MLAKRQPLLWAFAGGCVWGAALIVFWDGDAATSSRAAPVAYRVPTTVAPAPNHDDSVASVEPSTPKTTESLDTGSEPGSSVADVLAGLEAAYRERLSATAPVTAPSSTAELAPSAVNPPPPAPVATAAAPVATTALAAATPAPVAAQPVVTVIATTAPPKSAPPSDAAPAVASPADAAPVLASRDAAPPRDVYNGDVTVHQGDMVQQIAILQYMQLLALPPYGQLAPPVAPPSGARTRGPRAAVSWRSSLGASRPVATVPYPTTLTNPDNPWGFNFPPTPLTK